MCYLCGLHNAFPPPTPSPSQPDGAKRTAPLPAGEPANGCGCCPCSHGANPCEDCSDADPPCVVDYPHLCHKCPMMPPFTESEAGRA